MNSKFTHQSDRILDGAALTFWRSAQVLLLVIGVGIFLSLLFFPTIGLHAFWDVVIPVAPALFVLSTGVWRNICPLGTVSLLPRHFGFSKSRRLSLKWQGRFHLIGVCGLFLIVPLRHILLDVNGLATATVLFMVAAAAFTAGYFFEWKSGWCSGLCPVHPVEKLYGEKVLFTPPNAHCGRCANCVIPCPDSTPAMNPAKAKQRSSHRIASLLLTGGLPGFIWGRFHVPDCRAGAGWQDCVVAFGLPYLAMAASLGLFALAQRFLPENLAPFIQSLFAAAAVSCYYWYRIPALIGYGLFPADGRLADLTNVIPAWIVSLAQMAAVAFFGWWLAFKKTSPAQWAIRPPFARRIA